MIIDSVPAQVLKLAQVVYGLAVGGPYVLSIMRESKCRRAKLL